MGSPPTPHTLVGRVRRLGGIVEGGEVRSGGGVSLDQNDLAAAVVQIDPVVGRGGTDAACRHSYQGGASGHQFPAIEFHDGLLSKGASLSVSSSALEMSHG